MTQKVRDPSTAQDWNSMTALFFNYCVCKFKVRFIPKTPAGNKMTVGYYQPLYAVYNDMNDGATPGSIAAMIQYENCKVLPLYKAWKLYYNVSRSSSGNETMGWQSTDLPSDAGKLYLYGTGLAGSEEYGKLIITYYVKFNGRR